MIKIPPTKYIGLADKHYSNIRQYIITATKFYLKNCYTVDGSLNKSRFDFSEVDRLNASSKRSLCVPLLVSNLKYNDINSSHIFNINHMQKDFIDNVEYFAELFEKLLNNASNISIKKIIWLLRPALKRFKMKFIQYLKLVI